MADSPINGFPTTATDVPAGSYFGFDRWNGAAFETAKITQADLAAELGAHNMANANLTLAANRQHDGNSFRWTLAKLKDCTLEAFIAPTLGVASINLNGFGSTAADVTHRFKAGSSTLAEMYGDLGAKFNGSIGVNIAPDGIVPAWLTIESTDTKRPFFVNSTSSANAATFQAVTGRAVIGSGSGDIAVYGLNSAGGDGVRGTSTSGVGVRGQSPTYAGYFEGDVYVETNGLTGTPDASAVFEVNSTTKGMLPPRMATAQKNAIPSPATGLVVFDIDRNRLEHYTGTFWAGFRQTLNLFHGSWGSPAANTEAHFGGSTAAPQTSGSLQPVFNFTMRGNGVIRACNFVSWASGIVGTNEAWELYIRHNSTNYLVASVSAATAIRTFSNSALNIQYVDGDTVRLYYKNPTTWSQAPTVVFGQGTLTLQ